MKTTAALVCSFAATLACLGQSQPADLSRDHVSQSEGQYQVVERGPDHRVWSRVETVKGPSGKEIKRTHSYTELAAGLLHRENGQWRESRAEFEVSAQGYAVAQHGNHKVTISPVLNDGRGAVVVECAGQKLRSTIVGLSIHDRVSGESMFIAEIKPDIVGNLVSPNEVLFENCSKELPFDVRYVYEIGGFHQDVILRGSPDPAWLIAQGFNPETSTIEIWTEFFESPEPRTRTAVVSSVANAGLRSVMAEPDLVEEHLDYGSVSIPLGRAYMRKASQSDEVSAAVSKRWLTLDGRTFLVESLPIADLQTLVASLPAWKPKQNGRLVRYAANHAPTTAFSKSDGKVMMASARQLSSPSVVLDYYLSLNSGLTNYTFRSDTTYYVLGALNLYGTNVLEGGTVIKFAKNANAQLNFLGHLVCKTEPYFPAVLTAVDDNSAGERIPGSTGSPSGTYAYAALRWASPSVGLDLHDLRISHANYGILLWPGGSQTHKISDSQFSKNGTGFYIDGGSSALLRNLLFYQSSSRAVYAASATIRAEHLTIDQAAAAFSGGTVSLTNSLLVAISSWTTPFTGFNNATNSSSLSVFQSAAAGAHYLPTNSPYLGIGTTNISPELRAKLQTKTTAAPLILAGDVTNSMVLGPFVVRGSATPDLGFHYDPIDYAASSAKLRNADLEILPGTVIGAGKYGIRLGTNANLSCSGTPLSPIVFTRCSAVQESNSETNWVDVEAIVSTYNSHPLTTSASFSFTKWYCPGSESSSFQVYSRCQNIQFSNSEFYGGWFEMFESPVQIQNCVFNRAISYFENTKDDFELSCRNSLFTEGSLSLFHFDFGDPTEWLFRDNVFHQMQIAQEGDAAISHDYNGYSTGYQQLAPTGSNDVVLNISFETGPLGNYYLPAGSSLINTGSVFNAGSAGLYHFTVQTNQALEANSRLDIGYHYVALDSAGQPYDTDADGLPDYQEDANGNGVLDPGETSYLSSDTDYDGRTDLDELYDETDPTNPNSHTNVALATFKFNTGSFLGEAGQVPLTCIGSNMLALGVETNAVDLTGPNGQRLLGYRHTESNSKPNINLRSGTLRFWFKPSWSSITNGGSGLGAYGRLLEIGQYSGAPFYGHWALILEPGGDRIYMWAQKSGSTNLQGSTPFMTIPGGGVSNRWRQFSITYSPTNTAFYVDGVLFGTCGGLGAALPSEMVREEGFTIGSDKYGYTRSSGSFDVLETFNYQLPAGQIGLDFTNSWRTADFDSDGLPNWWEQQYGLDLYSSADSMADPDYDGRNNTQEFADGTSPTDANSAAQIPMACFRFNQTNWIGDQGQLPMVATGLSNSLVLGVETNAVDLTGPNGQKLLRLRHTESSGSANINLGRGTVRFWFKPAWSSVTNGGTGLGGTYARLLECGRYTGAPYYGNWALIMEPRGERIYLWGQKTGSTNEQTGTAFVVIPGGMVSNQWRQLTITYSPTNTAFYVDGVLAGNSSGLNNYIPSELVREEGFTLGTDNAGNQKAAGCIDLFETFNYQLSAAQILSSYNSIYDSDADGVPFWQDADSSNPLIGQLRVIIDQPLNGTIIRR